MGWGVEWGVDDGVGGTRNRMLGFGGAAVARPLSAARRDAATAARWNIACRHSQPPDCLLPAAAGVVARAIDAGQDRRARA